MHSVLQWIGISYREYFSTLCLMCLNVLIHIRFSYSKAKLKEIRNNSAGNTVWLPLQRGK